MKRSILFKTASLVAISLIFSSTSFSEELKVVVVEPINPEVRYPTEVIARPSVMPTGIFGTYLDASVDKLRTLNFGIRTEFGLVKKLEGRFSWDGFDVDTKATKDKLSINRTVNLGLKYNYLSIPHVSFSGTLNVPLHIFSGEILKKFTLGLPVVFYNDVMAGGIFGDLFTLTMRDQIAARFDFKWWYGLQIYGNLWADISSSFGHVQLQSKKNIGKLESKGFWQELPLTLTVIYAFNNYFDLGANAGFKNVINTKDVKAKDTFNFGLTFTARAGRIFG